MGTFHHVSKGHLHRYCDEVAFRYTAAYDARRATAMLTDDESISATPSEGERALVARLGSSGLQTIDVALISQASPHWLKGARVIADALAAGRFPADDDHVALCARRLILLVESHLLEGQGNLLRPRWSEVRLPGASPMAAPKRDL